METLALIDLAGFVALLLWGLHMVQSGILRAFGPQIRQFLRHSLNNRFSALGSGVVATTLLQSSTAVGLIAAAFTANGAMGLVSGLAVMLGANVGTTLIVQVLAFNIAVVTPIFVLVGVIAFRTARNDTWHDLGRAFIGLGLMLFALEQLTGLLHRAAGSEALHAVLALIQNDLVLSLVIAAILTWAIHSSIAVVLLTMSFAVQGLMPLPMACAFVLGANLGSAINPLLNMLSQNNPAALRLPAGNLVNRLAGCAIALPLLPFIKYLPTELTADTARAVANFHMAFNLVMAALFLPVLSPLAAQLTRRLRERTAADPALALYLDPALRTTPNLAIANAAREVMRMADVAETMLRDLAAAFTAGDAATIDTVRQTDDVLDRLNQQVKLYLTSLPSEALSASDRRRSDEILAFSLMLEHIGDVVSGSLARRAAKRLKRGQVFSAEGSQDIADMFAGVSRNVHLAATVFMTGGTRAGNQLLREKAELDALEARASRAHFDRLRAGESADSSAVHLDVLRDLRLINAQLVSTVHDADATPAGFVAEAPVAVKHA